jgi:hypothetical protein
MGGVSQAEREQQEPRTNRIRSRGAEANQPG